MRTPLGSLGIWTAERRLLESELRRALETASSEDGSSFGGSGSFFKGLGELWGCFEGRLDGGVGGGERRRVLQGPGVKALHLGFDVAKPARSKAPDGRKARGCILNGGIWGCGCMKWRSVESCSFKVKTRSRQRCCDMFSGGYRCMHFLRHRCKTSPYDEIQHRAFLNTGFLRNPPRRQGGYRTQSTNWGPDIAASPNRSLTPHFKSPISRQINHNCNLTGCI